MYAADLEELDWDLGKVTAIGWLERGHKFHRGRVETEVMKRLCEMLAGPWQGVAAAGVHACSFCPWSGGPATFRLFGEGPEVRLGVNNLWVPSDEKMYVAPSLILHYIDAHHYAPPKEFRLAVLKCPAMRSMAYLRAIGNWKRQHSPDDQNALGSPGEPRAEIVSDSGASDSQTTTEPGA